MRRIRNIVLASIITFGTVATVPAMAAPTKKVVVIYISGGKVTVKPTRAVHILRVMAVPQSGQITVTVYYN